MPRLHRLHGLRGGLPVHAIYADADVPTEYTKDIEFNVLEANQLKDSGAPAITVRKDALPTANDRKKLSVIKRIRKTGNQEKIISHI